MFSKIITGGDEAYTRTSLVAITIDPLTEFCKKLGKEPHEITIWCPFDVDEDMTIDPFSFHTEDDKDIVEHLQKSKFVTVYEELGYNVISSHIATGQDFLEYEPFDHYDIIISNPPFKKKLRFFERAVKLGKPFMLLSPANWISEAGFNTMADLLLADGGEIQLLVPHQRPEFDFTIEGKTNRVNKVSFKAVYYCRGVLDVAITPCYLDRRLDENDRLYDASVKFVGIRNDIANLNNDEMEW